MSESDMRGKVVRVLRELNAISVENPALPGTPDVNYVEGWIELKWLRSWPANDETPVRFEHFTPQQRVWHIRRRRKGGRSWVLVQCRRDWLLFDGAVAALKLNFMTKTDMFVHATKFWTNGLPKEELRQWVSRTQNEFSLTVDVEERLKEMLRTGTMSQ